MSAAGPAVARVSSFSGGLGSWYVSRRVRDEHGVAGLTLLHTDAGTEDAASDGPGRVTRYTAYLWPARWSLFAPDDHVRVHGETGS